MSETWVCAACQTVNGDNPTCSVCESPNYVDAPTERVPIVQAIPGHPAPGRGSVPGQGAAQGFSPGSTGPAPGQGAMAPSELPSSHGKRRGTLIAVIVLLLLVVAGGAYALGSKGSDGTETSGRESADRGQVSDDQNAEPAPKTTESTKATTSSPSAPVLTTAPAPTVAPSTTVPGSFEVPPGGRIWVAMRLSVTSEADARSFAADIPGAYVFPTTGWASLTPDYWVVAVGTYGSSDEVLQYCRDNGLTTSHDCVALPVSMNPDDHAIRPSLENPSGTT